ncbi:transposase for IS1330 [Salmonella enterica subsp. enterica serovar Newport str. SHSN004]|nr:transposase for IS1330 [Salmonella enterica subsp. enterica serovar Newport str. Shandong_3]OSJ66149.1 transposase for IS1330 [Salmonella enterica subsp. enterica serovar Newport str. SHSN004]OSJ92080.1 transposase for IS1330 [Salmonella enterica subsp. enterica serovar Newport str. SHSN012]
MQQNSDIQNEFLDVLSGSISPASRVIIITDAGFHNAWFKHIKSLGWEFIGRIRGNTLLRLDEQGAEWLNPRQLQASSTLKYLGPGSLSRKLYARCEGHFYLQKTHRSIVKTNEPGEGKHLHLKWHKIKDSRQKNPG